MFVPTRSHWKVRDEELFPAILLSLGAPVKGETMKILRVVDTEEDTIKHFVEFRRDYVEQVFDILRVHYIGHYAKGLIRKAEDFMVWLADRMGFTCARMKITMKWFEKYLDNRDGRWNGSNS